MHWLRMHISLPVVDHELYDKNDLMELNPALELNLWDI